MKIEEPDLTGTYSYSDYLTWQWTEMTELIRVKIYKMSTAPGSTHQKVSMKLTLDIGNFLKGKKCQLFSAPFDVRLPLSSKQKTDKQITTVVQPDLCVVCDPSKIDDRGCLRSQDWSIENHWMYSLATDQWEKFEVYQDAGVHEYWVVHPQE